MPPKRADPYRDNDEHIADELRWLDGVLALRTHILHQRLKESPTPQTVYISHEEVDWLLGRTGSSESASESGDVQRLRRELRALEARIESRARRSLQEGIYLALHDLAQLFVLSRFEYRAVVICLAPELERKYDKLYAYLQDDITRKRPSVDLILDLACDDEAQRRAGRALLTDHGALVRAEIVQKTGDPASPSGSSGLAQFLRLDPRILGFLLDRAHVDSRLLGLVRVFPPAAAESDLFVDPSIEQRVARLLERGGSLETSDLRRLVLYLHGPEGVGRRELALKACARLGCRLVTLDVKALLRQGQDFEHLLRLAFREGLLMRAAVYLEDAQPLLGEDGEAQLKLVARMAAEYGWLVFLAGEKPWARPGVFKEALFSSVALPMPEATVRKAAWTKNLAPHQAPESWATELAGQYRLTPGQIEDAVASAALEAATREEPSRLELADLYVASRQQSHHRLGDLAVKIGPRATWQELILPTDQVEQLGEMCSQVRYQHEVFGRWGFGRVTSRSRGISALFTGPPGTGKTLAAEVVAAELQLDLYKVDLSGVVSKYVGETEKNLSRIFQEAETSNAILFFDEADALFGKRTKVSDAHDRYANIETSYLLQRMEAYEGIVVLATNLRENMDEAFTRRIRFIIEFPFPDELSRRRIWAGHFPREAPLSPDIDLDYLARELKIAGGGIRNIVLNAAFLAASNGRVIEMGHLLHATRRELEKMGKRWAARPESAEVKHG
jgi:hypothetical protein